MSERLFFFNPQVVELKNTKVGLLKVYSHIADQLQQIKIDFKNPFSK